MEKYYRILGLNKNSNMEDLKNSRNKMLKKYHPDYYFGNSKFAEEKTGEINEAYQKLKPIFEEKEKQKKLQKMIDDKKKNITTTTEDLEKTIKNQQKIETNNIKTAKIKEKTKKTQTTKEKLIDDTLIKDERKKEKDAGKRVLDITIFVLGGIAILLIILFLTGVIR